MIRLLCLFAFCVSLALGQIDCSCDVALVLDVSGSIRAKDLPSVRSFATTIVTQLTPKMRNGAKGARVGVIAFSNQANVIAQLTPEPSGVISAINAMQGTRGTTRTDLAIIKAADMLTANRVPGKCLSIQIMTDGISNYPTDTTRAAMNAKSAGITVVAIGVGPMVNSTELRMMASSPWEKNAIKISEFIGLKQIAHSLWDKCSTPIQNQTSRIDYCECDIMIILDASGSISNLDWQHMKDFARTIIRNYRDRLGMTAVRIGIIQFAYRANLVAPLSYDGDALLQVVDTLQKTTGTTNTTDALLRADAELFGHRRSKGNCQAIRMVTDGRSNNPTSTAEAAYKLKGRHGIQIMAFGVGPLVDRKELETIASEPLSLNVRARLQFNQLDALANEISLKCRKPKPPPVLKYNYCHCDLIFIFDASGSIRASDWLEVKKFALIVLNNIKDGLSDTGTRVSIIHFHNRADMVLNLTSDYTRIRGAIETMKKSDGTTRTWLALDLAHQEFVDYTRGLGKCRYVMVLSDGQSNNSTKTIASAQRLKSNDLVLVQAVGVGPQASSQGLQSELLAINSNQNDAQTGKAMKPIFLTGQDSFQQLSNVAHQVFDRCNTTTPEPPIPVPTPEVKQDNCTCDVMLVLDASGSIQASDWIKAKDFARIMITGLAPFMAANTTRLGIIAYSSRARLVLPLTYDTHLAQGIIDALNKTTGTTRTDLALAMAERHLWANRRGNGDCRTVKLITDGQSNDPAKTERVAHQLKFIAYVYALGVGPLANKKELSIIATKGDYEMLQSFDGLAAIAHRMTDPCLKRAKEKTPTPMIQRDDCRCDMMLVFDASGSIWTSHWTNVKQFASSIVRDVQYELASGQMRIGIVMFANSAQLVQQLTSDNVTLLNSIAAMNKTNGSTRTWKGLTLASQELMRVNRGLTSCKTIKLITDGNSNIPSKTIATAHQIKADNQVTIMAAGVGRLVTNTGELKAVASTPLSENFEMIDDFAGLQNLAKKLFGKCKPKAVFDECKCNLVMVLDVSGSITLDELELTKGFGLTIAKGMQPRMGSGEVQLGLVTFASQPKMEMNLTRSYSALVTAIGNIQKTNGITRTGRALTLAANMLVNNQRNVGDCKSIKLVTDGQSTFPTQTAAAATYIKSKLGITIMAIGVGPAVGLGELRTIASAPVEKNMKHLKNGYSGLNDVAHLIADKCSGKFDWSSKCDMKKLMSCLTSTIPSSPCAEMDLYKTCAMANKCPDLLRIWCGMIFKASQYGSCSQQQTVCAPTTKPGFSKCDLSFYSECYNQMKLAKNLDQCTQLNKYVWCAEAAVCGDLVRYLCIKDSKGGEVGVTANGCKVTSCGHVTFQVDDETRRLVQKYGAHASELNASPTNWIVVALGCVVGALAIGLVAVAVKYRNALQQEKEELTEELM
eukprot:NODE_2_length_4427_cov_410.796047_g1_i0.p1 GENE.NODE_2_length_4427_cov_410.796047_g1_i0~~NODE_2_length_4427_cov_410.796047_g1_i0.p1  ORF type:complete len:1411 (+),score=340.99 NODE_2_length_4427_cov_410.796047_g1_i0:55-4287(+)